MTTAVPSIQITSTGVTVPSEQDILAGVWADISSAFGGGLNQSLSTPQGQLAQSLAAIIGDCYATIAQLVNQIDPDNADGAFQDAIGRIYYLNRVAAAGTLVSATVRGLVGAVIPAGSQARDLNGNLYALTAAVTIGAGGSIPGQFQALTAGPIACPAGTLTTIVSAVAGWESVTNAADGAPGNLAENRIAFETRRRNSVAINSVNTNQAILAGLLSVSNVLDAFVVDNPTSAPVAYGSTGYTLPANSICASVAGGTSADVAAAIWARKAPGCGYAGNTTINVTDAASLATPKPVYPVTYLVPTAKLTYFLVQIKLDPRLPSDISNQIKGAIVSAFSGADGGPRARIASQIYSGRYYAAIASLSQYLQIISIGIGFSSGTATLQSVAYGIDELPSINSSAVTVAMVP